jgi:hypothetical protein
VLSSTNLIENLFSPVREIGRRVKHWQSGTIVLRWTAAGVIEDEPGFRKLWRYRAMPTLVSALLLLVSATKLSPCGSTATLERPHRVLAPAGMVGLEKTASAAAENKRASKALLFEPR